jgi:exopolysaccharide biosynthesis polyprenyl glycosylphosphotransferase
VSVATEALREATSGQLSRGRDDRVRLREPQPVQGAADHKQRLSSLRAEVRGRAALARRALVAADVAASCLAVAIVALTSGSAPRPATLLLAVLVVGAGKLNGFYDRDEVRLRKSTLEEIPGLFQLAGLSALALWLGDGSVFAGDLGRGDVMTLWIVLFASLGGFRLAARSLVAAALPPERCLIVGDRGAMERLTDTVAGRQVAVVGRIQLGEAIDIEQYICGSSAHRIIVVPGEHGDTDEINSIVSHAQQMGVYVSVLPTVGEVIGSSVEFDHVGGLVLLGVHRFGLSRSSWFVKRTVDVIGSGLGLLLLSPVFLVTAILIRRDSRGPVFFSQPRVGHRGKHFEMIKFRTMFDGADRVRSELAALSSAGDGLFKVRDDPRVTPIGRVLRRYSLDELPQLINVFRGDMSLVGPRPLVIEEDARVEGRHRRRLQLTPGMTGPWQVLGTAEHRIPLREMLTLDYQYLGTWSLWTDVKLLLRTLVHVVRGRGL